MKPRILSLSLLALVSHAANGQDFSQLWQLGDENGNQSEFSQENGSRNQAPGSPTSLDDDYYFAGTYAAPIGVVGQNEIVKNYERALVPSDPHDRIHFNLDAITADPNTELRVTIQTCCLGALEGIDPTHDVVVRFNDKEFFAQNEVIEGILIEKTQKASAFGAKAGHNIIEIERTGGSDSSWIQFDYIRLEFTSSDTDKDGLPNNYEKLYPAFLDAAKPEDATKDQDSDGLTNLEEFKANTKPDQADTDGDGLNDTDEVKKHASNPLVKDSDSDGLEDAAEVSAKTNLTDADTDEDGLSDGLEVNTHKTDPNLADTDKDGVNDAEEVKLGSDPNSAASKPVTFAQLWQIGEVNGNQSEFSQERGGSAEAPGSAEDLDDDYYLAGTYPDPIGKVAQDEDWTLFERALTSGNFFSRMHFNLTAPQATATSEYQLTFELCCLGSAGGESIHDLTFRFNGNEFHAEPQLASGKRVQQIVKASIGKPVVGENIIEIERTEGSPSSWVQFDYIRAEQRDPGSVQPAAPALKITDVQRTTAGLVVRWTSAAAKKYGVEYSSDLKIWQNIASVDGTAASSNYTDADAGRRNAPKGYYRVRLTN